MVELSSLRVPSASTDGGRRSDCIARNLIPNVHYAPLLSKFTTMYLPNSSRHATEGKISASLAYGQERTSSIINEMPKIKKPLMNVELVVT